VTESSVAGQSPSTTFEPANLLVRGVNWLGDAVMTMPAIQRLRERFPQAQITLLTNEKLADLWQQQPGINRIVAFGHGDNPWSVAQRLRGSGFDAALVLPNSPRSALEVWLARIPHRIGYAGKWRTWLLTRPLKYPADRSRLRRRGVREIRRLIREGNRPRAMTRPTSHVHQMHDYLYLTAALGANPAPLPPQLELNADEIEATAAFLSEIQRGKNLACGGHDIVWLGLNPSTAYGPAKRWPAKSFAEVVREVSRRVPNGVWLTFGTGADWEICEQVAGRGEGRIINLAGKTSLRQLMGLLKKCRLLLTNDSGPMHVAAALGTPVIVPFGSTSPELTAPGQPGDPHHYLLTSAAPCAPCFRRTCPIDFRCMTGIPVERVVTAVLEAITS
jgi:lipopolysaccharide heptosyltransferase II